MGNHNSTRWRDCGRKTLVSECERMDAQKWFGGACPRCDRRAQHLYYADGRTGCRVCLRLCYPSQLQRRAVRPLCRRFERDNTTLKSAVDELSQLINSWLEMASARKYGTARRRERVYLQLMRQLRNIEKLEQNTMCGTPWNALDAETRAYAFAVLHDLGRSLLWRSRVRFTLRDETRLIGLLRPLRRLRDSLLHQPARTF